MVLEVAEPLTDLGVDRRQHLAREESELGLGLKFKMMK